LTVRESGVPRRIDLVALLAGTLLLAGQSLAAQTLTVRAAGETLHVRAAGLAFIEGRVLDRLEDGRAVRVDFELSVLERPDGKVVATVQHSFNVSFDLWEERFAVSRIGTPPRSVSHLRPRDAEAWCLDNVTLPLPAIGRFARDVPFWIRLTYRVQDPLAVTVDQAPLTLWTLIDVLSRRAYEQEWGRSVAGGPFRLTR
jgi:hypothetical protein